MRFLLASAPAVRRLGPDKGVQRRLLLFRTPCGNPGETEALGLSAPYLFTQLWRGAGAER